MNDLYIGFSRPKGWLEPYSWLIRFGYWTPYSHAYIKWYSPKYKRFLIFQASGPTLNLVSEEVFVEKELVVHEFKLQMSDENLVKMLNFAISVLGEPYDIKGVLGLGLVRILQLVGIKINNPFKWDGSCAFCSELVGYLLDEYDNIVVDNGNFSNIAPKDLYEVLLKLPTS